MLELRSLPEDEWPGREWATPLTALAILAYVLVGVPLLVILIVKVMA